MRRTRDLVVGTIDEAQFAIERARRKLGESAYQVIKCALDEVEANESSTWIVIHGVGKRQKYACSSCGKVSPVPTRHCQHCGKKKVDADGNIKKVDQGDNQ